MGYATTWWATTTPTVGQWSISITISIIDTSSCTRLEEGEKDTATNCPNYDRHREVEETVGEGARTPTGCSERG